MKKFEFRLQKILDLRKKLEDAQRLKLAAAAAFYNSLLHRQEAPFARAAEERSAGGMGIAALRQADILYKKAEQTRAALQPEVDAAKLILDKEQEIYTKLHRATQSLAVLRKKHLEAYLKEELRQEIAEIDEMSKRPRA